MYLAELNIAFPKLERDDPKFAFFFDNIDKINNLASRMDGFVWRYGEDGKDLPPDQTPWPNAVVNMSVWENPKGLEHFVWNTVHKNIYDRKEEWFEAIESHFFAMWWVEEGHVPTLDEAKIRLDRLNEEGNSEFAFGWSHLPNVKLWQQQRCG
ncbi:MAG: DUF3291 domain-containing protein [Rhizobiales bacterium]|nr:DUF3291 domain-containing protein [Hyphomicrobiales bacterium]